MLWLVQRFEFLVGGHHQLVGVALALPALCVGNGFGEQTRPVEVDVRVEVLAAEGIHEAREALRDVAVAQVFAHEHAIL